MENRARLLSDIRERLIDVVVVYKVDRLTRSLADFAKIVEILTLKGCRLWRSPSSSIPRRRWGA
jgi:DNA invertase Pin-like site-specific DNA recombinase